MKMMLETENIGLALIDREDMDFVITAEHDTHSLYIEWGVCSVMETYLARLSERENKDIRKNYFDFMVYHKTTNKYIGLAQLWLYSDIKNSYELGIAILPEYQGKGHAQEAIALLGKYTFEGLKAHKLIGMCNAENKASWRSMENAGMMLERTFLGDVENNGKRTDQLCYAIQYEDYFPVQKN